MIVSRYREGAYGLMRLFVGLLFSCHGAQKLFGALGGTPVAGKPLLMTAGVIEFFGGLAVAIGLFTSLAAFIASGEMAVAYFTAHAPRGFWPVQNQGELAAVYCFVFLAIAAMGGGRYSMDELVIHQRSGAETPGPSGLRTPSAAGG